MCDFNKLKMYRKNGLQAKNGVITMENISNVQIVVKRKKGINTYRLKEYAAWYAMLAMPLIGFLVFNVYPIVWAMQKAWYYYDGALSTMRFVGWSNFIDVLTKDSTYWMAWLTTIRFTLLKIPLEMILAMLIALILHKKLKGCGFFRSVYYMPSVISIAVIGVVFANMFDFFGFVNGVLMKIGIINEGINWFDNSNGAMFVLVMASIWNTFGINVMYLLAALSNIPEEVYESASLDGASKSRIFFQITLPLMGPVLQTILLLSINGTLLVNDLVLVTTNGAPAGETYTIMAYVTSKFIPGFVTGPVNIGYGAAAAIIMGLIMAVISAIYFKLSNKLSNIY
jgi:ABC-type sugar transport system permease subunit